MCYCWLIKFVVVVAAAANDDDDDVECNCDKRGTTSQICTKDNGQCLCENNIEGPRCDRCSTGYYDFPNCRGLFHLMFHLVSHLVFYVISHLVYDLVSCACAVSHLLYRAFVDKRGYLISSLSPGLH